MSASSPLLDAQNAPLAPPTGAVPARPKHDIAALNARYKHHSATAVIEATLKNRALGNIAMVSSFGAESVVLLHMMALIDNTTPVLFLDTQLLFTETLVYQTELAERLNLRNIRIITAADADIAAQDPDKTLHQFDTDACCNLRKTVPLNNALAGYDGWITGRKRFQGATRSNIEFFEADPNTNAIKVNPLTHWAPTDVQTYIEENRLPRHPMVARGYPSIGCMPCTSAVKPGEDPRAGRWRGQDKEECGIHFENGKMVRTPKKNT